jgi:membrane-bound lytic murein transglycosylase D
MTTARLGLVLALVGALAVPARALPAGFDKPAALVGAVALWKKVYSEWTSNDVAFHDEDDLSLVYRVVQVPDRGAKDEQGRTRKQVVAAEQQATVAALKALQKKQPKSVDGLDAVEREIFLALQKHPRTDKFAGAARVRGQGGIRERFVSGVQKSGLYANFITEEFKRNGLPPELIGVAFVESMFIVGARSKVGAAGIWQFMPYTGREYMQVNQVVDERWDPILATEAAARYLRQAKSELGTWPLAITSYNYGRGGMRRLASAAGTQDFGVILAVSKEKRFGFAARNYYASFLAVLEILEEAGTRLAGVTRFAPWAYDVVRLPFPLLASQLVGTGIVDEAILGSLNPALSDAALGSKLPLPHGLSLRVPPGTAGGLLERLAALPDVEKVRGARAAHTVHVANGRQTLAAIARKQKVEVGLLVERTGLPASAVPARGAKVEIPAPLARYTLLPEARAMPLPPLPKASPAAVAAADVLVAAAAAPPSRRAGSASNAVVVVRVVDVEDVAAPAVGAAGGSRSAMPPGAVAFDVDVIAGLPPGGRDGPVVDAGAVPLDAARRAPQG